MHIKLVYFESMHRTLVIKMINLKSFFSLMLLGPLKICTSNQTYQLNSRHLNLMTNSTAAELVHRCKTHWPCGRDKIQTLGYKPISCKVKKQA